MEDMFPLVRLLADGRTHSGEHLGKLCGVSRAAIHKRVNHLNERCGLEIFAMPGKGYRLANPIELLDYQALEEGLGQARASLDKLVILPEIDSTNSYLMNASRPENNRGVAAFAEYQSAGRGRMGREWIAPVGSSLAFSLAWRFDLPLAAIGGLSIACGVALAEALTGFGLAVHSLKWPNDLLIGSRKLAGILVEASGELSSTSYVVIGVGINLAPINNVELSHLSTSLAEYLSPTPDRNMLAATLLRSMIVLCHEFQGSGLSGFLDRWQKYDGFCGREVRVIQGDRQTQGRYAGLSDQGCLLLDSDAGRSVHCSGELSMRSVD